MYGGIKSKGIFDSLDYAFDKCLGYVDNDKADRIYSLKGQSTDEWLIEYYTKGFMEQPIIYREINKKEKKKYQIALNHLVILAGVINKCVK